MSSSSSSATSRLPLDDTLHRGSLNCLDSPPDAESKTKIPRDGVGKRHARVNSIMGLVTPDKTNNSIDDSNIVNMNQMFLKHSCEVVRDSIELGMTFVGSKD